MLFQFNYVKSLEKLHDMLLHISQTREYTI